MPLITKHVPVEPAEHCRRCGARLVRKAHVEMREGQESAPAPTGEPFCGAGCTPFQLQQYDKQTDRPN
ncbi:hypothetical protein AB0904_27725 [Streptomyces sp. NPDC006684]|uniref:hypothetical protein n=1 Tax=Streptomyces sp. NPDC006684 TaxID=3154477 RepID=UPI003456EA67